MNIDASPIVERVRVMVASASDVSRERDHVSDLAEELNRGVAKQQGLVVEVVRWESHSLPELGRPQQIIFDQMGPIDIVVLIMWQRFGTPTGVAASGTEEEFDWALRSWQQTGVPRVLSYFGQCEIPPPTNIDDAEQLLQVARFHERVNGLGLAFTYESDSQFKEMLREHLQRLLMSDFGSRRPALDRNLAQLLDLEKDRCRTNGVMFGTPNLLRALFSIRAIRQMLDKVATDKAERIVEGLRKFQAQDAFTEFDWFERLDVQAARLCAKREPSSVIEAHHLLLGFLDTDSETCAELRKTLGQDAFDRLAREVSQPQGQKKTAGVKDLFSSTP